VNQIETHPFHQQVKTQKSAMTNMIPEVAVLARRSLPLTASADWREP